MTKAAPAVPLPLTSMQVVVHTTCEQYLIPQPNDYGTYISIDERTHGLAVDPRNDIESGSDR